ncbi:RelB antitoxin [Candidatus Magnetomorum sp. HK-1]|nr:RelB antitoxin [Candidatus Magnetomorum sp. HK-1]
MSKSAMVRARMKPELKNHAESIFHNLGLNATQAITMFYKQVELRNGLPFDMILPTSTTKRTFDLTDKKRNLVICENVEDMFNKLGI